MKELPLGIQTFEKIRKDPEKYVYIDKTKEIAAIAKEVTPCFLSVHVASESHSPVQPSKPCLREKKNFSKTCGSLRKGVGSGRSIRSSI